MRILRSTAHIIRGADTCFSHHALKFVEIARGQRKAPKA